MKPIFFITVAAGLALAQTQAVSAQSLSVEALQQVKSAVIEICRGGSMEGRSEAFEISGQGDAKIVLLRRLAELGVDGRVVFSQREWKGLKAVIPEKWDQAAYNDCVNPTLRLFIDKLESAKRDTSGKIKLYENESHAVCGGRSYVSVAVYRRAARRPLQEIQLIGGDIDSGRIKLKVGESTTTTSDCRITLAQTGFDRDFYAQLSYRLAAR